MAKKSKATRLGTVVHAQNLKGGYMRNCITAMLAGLFLFFASARSQDGMWKKTGLDERIIFALVQDGKNMWAGTDGGVFLSTNAGASWTAVNTGLTNLQIRSLAINGPDLFVGTLVDGVFKSTDNGKTWAGVNTGLGDQREVRSFATTGSSTLFVATVAGVFRSTNGGVTWTTPNSGFQGRNTFVLLFSRQSGILFAGTTTGVFRSANYGETWEAVSNGLPTNAFALALAMDGGKLFVGMFGVNKGGVYVSLNAGVNWTAMNTGLTTTYVQCLTVINPHIFAGSFDSGVWKYTPGTTSAAERAETEVPANFSLEQNYPNPFNPSTEIKYHVSANDVVKLRIYNQLGQVVTTLVDKPHAPGTYSVVWDAKDVPTGTYYYLLEVGGDVLPAKKAVLVK